MFRPKLLAPLANDDFLSPGFLVLVLTVGATSIILVSTILSESVLIKVLFL